MANALNLIFPVPVNQGGTNSVSQSTNGIVFFDGSSLTSNSNFTYNSIGEISATNTTGSMLLSLIRQNSSFNSQLFFQDSAGTNSWAMGIISSDSLFHLITPTPGSQVTINSNAGISSTSFSVSQLVATDSSKLMVSANLSGDVITSGLSTTLATVNGNVGTFGSATQVGSFTVNAKGLITAASNITISGVAPGGTAGGDLTGTYPNPTIANLVITNAKIANSTIDLTAKVTGILPNANTTATSSNTVSSIVLRDGSGNFSAGIGTFSGLNNSSLTASYPVATDSSKNLISTNIASVYAFGTTNPTIDSNANTGINLISSITTSSAQLNVSNSNMTSSFTLWSGRVGDINPALMWSASTDLRFGTQTSGQLATAGFVERMRITSTGAVNILTGDLQATRASAGGVSVISSNTNNSSGTGNALLQAVSGGSSGGDALTLYNILAAQNWSTGIDNSDNDSFVICSSNTLGTNNKIRLDQNGDMSLVSGNLIISTTAKTLQFPFTDSDKILLVGKSNSAKIAHSATWNFGFYSGSFTSDGGGVSTGQFTWSAVDGTGSAFQTLMNLSNGGDLTASLGNLIVNTAGKTLKVKQGTNACSGTGAVMVAGTVTVNTTAVATGDTILLMKTVAGGTSTTGMPVVTIVNATSFTITGGALDTSTWSWLIIKPS